MIVAIIGIFAVGIFLVTLPSQWAAGGWCNVRSWGLLAFFISTMSFIFDGKAFGEYLCSLFQFVCSLPWVG